MYVPMVTIVAIYVCTSFFALRYPTLLHKKRAKQSSHVYTDHSIQEKNSVRNLKRVGHRGTRVNHPENTLEAFRYCLHSETIDGIEFDLRLTVDDDVIIHHDPTLYRMCGVRDPPGAYTAHTLPPISLPSRGDAWQQGFPDVKNGRIPRFEEVLKLLVDAPTMPDGRERCAIVEFKEGSDILIRKALDLVQKYKLEKRVIMFALPDDINNKVNKALKQREMHKTVGTMNSVKYAIRTYVYYYLGLLPFMSYEFDCFGMVVLSLELNDEGQLPFQGFIPPFLHPVYRWFALSVDHKAILYPLKLSQHLRARGVKVIMLGINDDKTLAIQQNFQADAILTDGCMEADCKFKDAKVGGFR